MFFKDCAKEKCLIAIREHGEMKQ